MKNKIWFGCIILLAVINIYWFWPGSLYFLNDDLLHIPLTDQGHLFQTNSVRPVHELLVRLDLQLWGKNAYGYHITALLLHFIVCLQLYDLCLIMQLRWLEIAKPAAVKAALLAVALFLAYPQSSESMAWILGRAPALSAVFFMITVRLFFNQNLKLHFYLIAAFFFAAALFTYEQCVLLPVALLWLAFVEREKLQRQKMLWFVVTLSFVDAIYIVIRKLITAEVVGGYEGSNFISFQLTALAANFFRIFFRLWLNPANISSFIFSIVVFFLLLAAVCLFLRKKVSFNKNTAVFFAAIILLFIAPVLSLGLAVNSFESGRYLYLPSIFLMIGVGIAGVAAYNQNNEVRTVLIALLLLFVCYWLWGKHTASQQYREASMYAGTMNENIQKHFANTPDTLFIDTLQQSIYRLPVFRLGFKTGIKWLNNNIDTNKIIVRNYFDEVAPSPLK